MSTHNICFRGEIIKISAFFGGKMRLICCYTVVYVDKQRMDGHADLDLSCSHKLYLI